MAADLTTTSTTLLDCVCDALATAGRPVCSCYATIGAPIIANCCECATDTTGEAVISFERMYEADPQTLLQVDRVRPCKGGIKVAEFNLFVSRCYPTLDEQGNLPTPEEQDEAALNLNTDVEIVWHALTCCGHDSPLRVIEIVVDSDPEGGCSALSARVAVEVTPARHDAVVPS